MSSRQLTPEVTAAAAHLAAAAAANSQLLRDVGGLAEVHKFAQQMREQVVALHRHMRLPHLGVSRSVPYAQLYVPPVLLPEHDGNKAPDLATVALPGRRSVLLGDPGAGKSTLAGKLAHDVAADLVPGAEGRVPFLLVLRDQAGSFCEGGKGLATYLAQVCQDPYNLEPPPHAIEYLLRNGRAMVLLDGLDELVEPALRRKVVQLVEGFVNRFPLVPVLVTARRVGYYDAALDGGFFSVGRVAELNNDQVEQYAKRWFGLDESIAEAKRAQMARSFTAESHNIGELRSNPLLLALLCAMYSNQHYIPANLAQVYERCAVMLFEQWDTQRGIAEAPQFHGRLRTAVQHLAWRLVSAEESGKALPRHRIVQLLAEHFTTKGFHEDDANSTAEQFVTFCTGRAWVLTDVGSTDIEPRYGFTHRTFLEYFAAEHLVRANPTPERLWETLLPHVLVGEWDVIAQIALQLLDRYMDGGPDEVLRLVLASSEPNALTLHQFAAWTLSYIHPAYDVIRAVAETAISDALEVSLADRQFFWYCRDFLKLMHDRERPLITLLLERSPGNALALKRAFAESLSTHIAEGNDKANLLLHLFSTTALSELLDIVTHPLVTRYAAAFSTWRAETPWVGPHSAAELEHIVRRFGPQPLYVKVAGLDWLPSAIEDIARTGPDEHTDFHHDLCAALISAQRPWIPDHGWWEQLHREDCLWRMDLGNLANARAWNEASIVTLTLLFLPYLETQARSYSRILPKVPLVHELWVARVDQKVYPELVEMFAASVPEQVAEFLASWACGEIDVVVAP